MRAENPMPFFVIPVLVGLGLWGVKKVGDASNDQDTAKRIVDAATGEFEGARQSLEVTRSATQASLANLGRLNLMTWRDGIGRFVSLFERIRNVEMDAQPRWGAFDIGSLRPGDLAQFERGVDLAEEALAGIGRGAGAGALVAVASYGGVAMFATASTGTAIAGLSGAAATNATLAWLGGGSLAAGGFGMAGGTMVLGGIVLAPALFIGGHVMAARAEAQLEQARAYRGRADLEIAKMAVAVEALHAINHITELVRVTIIRLARAAARAFDALEAVIGSRGTDYRRYSLDDRAVVHRAVLFAQGLKALLTTRFILPDGSIDSAYRPAVASASRLLEG